LNVSKSSRQSGDKLTLWGGGTVRTFRAHWMLHELDLDYDARLIGSRTGETQTDEFRALNPKEKIPVLVDGALVLSESAAIITYLADRYGIGTGLTPEPRTEARAHYDEWTSFILMELDAHTLYVMRRHRDLANLYGEAPAAIDAAIAGFQKQVAVADRALTDRDHLVGEQFTGVDILLTSCLDWAVAYQVGISERLESYRRHHQQRPAYRASRELNFSVSPGA
jgi:glutathione S-transferase